MFKVIYTLLKFSVVIDLHTKNEIAFVQNNLEYYFLPVIAMPAPSISLISLSKCLQTQ